ncbi:3167_t:CDS:2 [Ambispora gerdemannii]|uniref:3167_t:CDS:1 n=1 Tax=Ambispora gerdemannii TaxID=144530 RepID=A0A9N8VN15_9GLOM|nr:3167_t:CDS:2 [Ambispora gerdemannii]
MSDIKLNSQMTSSPVLNNDENTHLELPSLTTSATKNTSSNSIPTTPTSPSKLRQIAPAPPSPTRKSDYDIYHIPRGYEVVLVPKGGTVANSDNSNLIASAGTPLSPISPTKMTTKPITIPPSESFSQNQNSSSWRKRRSNGHIPRPKNCFMAYREHMQHQILQQNPGLNNKIVSVLAAQEWNKEKEEVKEYWREVAKNLKAEHQLKYPDYKFSPKKKPGKTVTGGIQKSSSKMRASAIKLNSSVVGSRKLNLTQKFDESAVVVGSTNLLHGNVDTSLWGHYNGSSWTTASKSSSKNSPSFEASSPGSFSPPTFQQPQSPPEKSFNPFYSPEFDNLEISTLNLEQFQFEPHSKS